MKNWILFLTLIFSCEVAAQQFVRLDEPCLFRPRQTDTGDLDSDGDLDIVCNTNNYVTGKDQICWVENLNAAGNLRPCFSSVFSVQYCNNGTLTAENAYVEVAFDSSLMVTGSTLSWSAVQGNTYTFDLGDIEVGACGQFQVTVMVDCGAPVGEINCATAHIYPDSLCNFPVLNWDGSVITVSGSCQGDSINFTINNIGTGDMQVPLDYRIEIVNDDIVMFLKADTFLLNAGQSEEVAVPAAGLALRMVAGQSANNPVAGIPAAIIPNCDSLNNDVLFSILSQFPAGNGDPFDDAACRPLTAAYDPNDKQALPTGFGIEHFIEPEWEINYLVRFQNTGTDTAFTVVIRDTLSPFLDPATLSPGAGSHPYSWSLFGNGVLIFTFDQIMLPDSNTNEPLSHGFIHFTITPKKDILPGSFIENTAFIYFDFNDPIQTNTVFHTVGKPIVYDVLFAEGCGEAVVNGQSYNTDTLVVNTTSFLGYDSVSLINIRISENYQVTIDTLLPLGEPYPSDTTFSIQYTSANGCDSIVTYNIHVITGTDEHEKAAWDVHVFPNPASDRIYCYAEGRFQFVHQVSIWNPAGSLLETLQVERPMAVSSPLVIDLKNRPPGLYCIKFHGVEGVCIKKVALVY